jgi:hypothetical protein
MSEHVEEETVRQKDDGTRHIGSVAAAGGAGVPDHVQRALRGPEPRIIQIGEDREPPLEVVHTPPVYPGGWKPE